MNSTSLSEPHEGVYGTERLLLISKTVAVAVELQIWMNCDHSQKRKLSRMLSLVYAHEMVSARGRKRSRVD
jgi:hypothetical protein